jgi:hypothetical protein
MDSAIHGARGQAVLPPNATFEEPRSTPRILYVNGGSTGDIEEAVMALLGKDAGGLSAEIIYPYQEHES